MKKFLSIILVGLMVVTMIPMAVLPASAVENLDYNIKLEVVDWAVYETSGKLIGEFNAVEHGDAFYDVSLTQADDGTFTCSYQIALERNDGNTAWNKSSISFKIDSCKDEFLQEFEKSFYSSYNIFYNLKVTRSAGHSFSDWTDAGDGTHTRICSVCSETETQNHSFEGGNCLTVGKCVCGLSSIDSNVHTKPVKYVVNSENNFKHDEVYECCGVIKSNLDHKFDSMGMCKECKYQCAHSSFTDSICDFCGYNSVVVIIDGTLGGKTTATEDDVNTLVEQLKGYVDSGITTIIVTGSEPALYNFYGIDTSAVSAALYYLADGRSDSPYCGTIDLILPDVTEIVDDEFNNTFALNSITLPKVTKLGNLAFYAAQWLQRITFGSVLTDVNETGGVVFAAVGEKVGGCDLILNCGQMNESSVSPPDLSTNIWKFRYENEFKSITLTHTEGTAATCTELAVCSVCGESYGELAEHTAEPTYAPNAEDSTKHDVTYSCCGVTVTAAHNYKSGTPAGACVCGAECLHSSFDAATGNCTDCETLLAIAKIETGETTTYYQTADDLRTAISEIWDDQTVTLLADFETKNDFHFFADGTENIFDLNGHTLTCDDRIVVGNCKLTITGTDSSKIIFTGANSSSTGLSNLISVDDEDSTIVVGSVVIQGGILRSVYGGVLDLTNATIPEAGLNVILYTDDWEPATYNVSDVLLLPADYYFFVDGKAVSSYSEETVGTVLKHAEHSYTYTDNGDGTHDATCTACGAMVDSEVHSGGTATYTDNGDGTHDVTYSCCGAAVAEVPHTLDVTTGKCSACGADMTVIATVTDSTNTYYAADAATLNQAVTAILETGSRTFTVELPADTEAEMITAIRRAICDTEGVADGSINLTLKGVTSIPGTTNWDGVAFGPCDIYDEAGEIVDMKLVTQLASINLPDVTEIGAQAFYFCENLVSVSAPKAQTIGAQALGYTALTSVEFPELTTIPTDMFSGTWTLSSAKFPKVTTIEQNGLLIGAKFKPENNPTPFPLELTAKGNITFNGSNHFNIASQNYSGKVDLVLNIDKKDQVTFNDDGTATWQVRDDLSYTFKSITFTCTDGTTNHSYTYTDNGDGTHDMVCTECGYVAVNETHSGGTATCTEQAECQHCGASYGEVDADGHDWSNLDGVCANGCGAECPHDNYTNSVCDKCGYECEHEWDKGVLTRPVHDAVLGSKDGYYTYTCTLCGKEKTETVKIADYSAYEAVSEEINALLQSDDLTSEAKQAIYSAANECGLLSNDLTESEQNIVDDLVAELEKIIADADEKIASGEYIKADYTEIDEAIASVDEALENATISEEMANELSDIKSQLEALKENENTSMDDVAELFERVKAVAQTMADCANGIHSFTNYEEVTAPECGKAGKEVAYCDHGCGATDEKEIPALTHEPLEAVKENEVAPKCGVAGSYDLVVYCDLCGDELDRDTVTVDALTHTDEDGDYLCDHGCGHEFEKPADPDLPEEPEAPEDPSDKCDHLCHRTGFMGFIWKIINFFFKLFNIQQYCDCGKLHY